MKQDLHDPAFLQDPYPFYDRARAAGPLVWWEDYGMYAAFDHASVHALLRDRRLGRAVPGRADETVPQHLAAFDAVERHSLLELEAPGHTRLRRLVLHAFTSRRIAGLGPEIAQICADEIARFPGGAFDLIPAYCQQVPVRVIARLLGVPEDRGPDLLRWSAAMVAMYQAGRSIETEKAANAAAEAFAGFLRAHIAARRSAPDDDLISELIAAEAAGTHLTEDEMIGTCVLLLNAGHEATVHSLGNAVKCLIETGTQGALPAGRVASTVEELWRYDPPLHMFSRHVYAPVQLGDVTLRPGDEVALVLGAAGRDPAAYSDPHRFDPHRFDPGRFSGRSPAPAHLAFGGGVHFCLGAPLARLEMQIALPALFSACPDLRLTEPPRYADSYHFHKLDRLMVCAA